MSSDQTWKEKYFQELESAEQREELAGAAGADRPPGRPSG